MEQQLSDTDPDVWPVGVFASIDAGLGVDLGVARELGVTTVHLHAPQSASRTPQRAQVFAQQLVNLGLKVTCVFCGFEGESYADIPTVAQTVGLVPETTQKSRLQEAREIADFARLLDVDVVGAHIGFVPHETNDAHYGPIVSATQQLCDHCARNGQSLHLETGQEPADVLLRFLHDVGRDNLFVNFDPANMILYGSGKPLPALKQLREYVRSVHCKDAVWSNEPGVTWGQEVPLGEGKVDFPNYLKTLQEIGYRGPLTIEREIPQEPARQKTEIGNAVALLKSLKQQLLA